MYYNYIEYFQTVYRKDKIVGFKDTFLPELTIFYTTLTFWGSYTVHQYHIHGMGIAIQI